MGSLPIFQKALIEDDPILEILKKCVAEVIGTAILVTVGCMGAVPPFLSLEPAFSFGFAVLIAVAGLGHISGAHINPAVTLAALVGGKISLIATACYIPSQILGSLLGYSIILLINPSIRDPLGNKLTNFCVTKLAGNVSETEGFVAEFVATSFLILLVCATMDTSSEVNNANLGLNFGLAVAGLIIAFGRVTGCGINPARSLGPAIITGVWEQHWLYWVAPMLGSLVTSLLYQILLSSGGAGGAEF